MLERRLRANSYSNLRFGGSPPARPVWYCLFDFASREITGVKEPPARASYFPPTIWTLAFEPGTSSSSMCNASRGLAGLHGQR